MLGASQRIGGNNNNSFGEAGGGGASIISSDMYLQRQHAMFAPIDYDKTFQKDGGANAENREHSEIMEKLQQASNY